MEFTLAERQTLKAALVAYSSEIQAEIKKDPESIAVPSLAQGLGKIADLFRKIDATIPLPNPYV